MWKLYTLKVSLRSRRQEINGRNKERSRERETREGRGKRFSGAFRAGAPSPLACLPRACPFFLAPIYFLATQAITRSSLKPFILYKNGSG